MKAIFSRPSHLLKVWILAMSVLPLSGYTQIISKIYPTSVDRTARDILRTPDGGYLIAGMTNNSDPFDSDLYLIKTNSAGDMVWDTVYGGAKPDYAYSMVEAHDGNYIIVGFTQSFGGGDYDMYFLKVNASGKFIKQVDYGGSGNEEARQIIRTSDNKYVVVGTKGLGTSNSQIVVVQMDENLENRQEWEYGGAGHDYGLAIQQAGSGDYMVAGQTWSKGAGGGDAYVLRLNPANMGTPVWDKTYGGALNEEVVGLAVNSDGTSVLAVRDSLANEPIEGNIDVRVIKISNSDGSIIYQNIFGGAEKDTPKTIVGLGNGEYVIGAISRSFNWHSPQMWLMKIRDDGSKLDTAWTRNFGQVYDHDHCHIAKPSHDGGILAAGHSRAANMRVWFMKLNHEGRLVVGLDENRLVTADVMVFPNPIVNGQLKVKCENNFPYSVDVRNILGELVYTGRAEENRTEDMLNINLSGNAAGIYLVTVRNDNSSVTRKILLK